MESQRVLAVPQTPGAPFKPVVLSKVGSFSSSVLLNLTRDYNAKASGNQRVLNHDVLPWENKAELPLALHSMSIARFPFRASHLFLPQTQSFPELIFP